MPGHYVALRVTDDGQCVSDQEWTDLFVPFAGRTMNELYGLGLSAVYRTVRYLRGTFLYQTRNRQGTDILILIPQTDG